MNQSKKLIFIVALLWSSAVAHFAYAQARPQDAALIARRNAIEKELESIAIIDRKVMVPMRDGKRMQADIYRPKDESKKYPIIFSRTPYNFNYWDVELGAPRDMSAELDAVKRGYIYIEMNERGRYFSEGDYDILGVPLTDSDDELDWMSAQPWATGKVGLIGCSSTAEWQLNVASRGNKALTAIIPESFGAGVGSVGPYYEQGNWFRGGAVQMLFATWLYDYGLQTNDAKPNFPSGTSQQALVAAAKSWDLAAHPAAVDWSKALWHLPEKDILAAAGGPRGIYADSTPSGQPGMIERAPNDPAWYKGGLWHDNQRINIPGLWLMTWYDVSVAPNLAAYNHVRQTADPAVADEQYAVIAPMPHCSYKRATEHTMVGERDMGDARLDYDALTWAWFDRFLKGEENGALTKTPKVQYYTMGLNKWQSSDVWPPANARPVTFYLTSAGRANSLNGDGSLAPAASVKDSPDSFTYDPMNPVLTHGGGFCCMGTDLKPGAIDQRSTEARSDVLVYSTDPLKQGLEVSGPIDVTLYVSSDAKDTDFTVKLVDVFPDGTAFNIDDNIQRVRYREGYDKPPVWMEKDKVYKVAFQPIQTSIYFPPGHRLRIEVSSSDFPRFDRNLNTGGNNFDETQGVVAHNQVHHSSTYQSSVTLSVVAH
ncbi:CocE/NonD family hydrolase [Terracidiphilus sp.]|jgi:putative CocE/NonD family hydrolase|uniref:CocE/NonD family hydrolase n=1 Tax=Terracidiphilus sp. TaxID=1964191 RepID=UPI003C2409DB